MGARGGGQGGCEGRGGRVGVRGGGQGGCEGRGAGWV